MISHIIVSGEGPSDLGGSCSGQAALSHDEDFEKGPFFYLIERMLNKYLISKDHQLKFSYGTQIGVN